METFKLFTMIVGKYLPSDGVKSSQAIIVNGEIGEDGVVTLENGIILPKEDAVILVNHGDGVGAYYVTRSDINVVDAHDLLANAMKNHSDEDVLSDKGIFDGFYKIVFSAIENHTRERIALARSFL